VSPELIHALRGISSSSFGAKEASSKVVNSAYFIWTALQDFQLCRYCRRFVINSLNTCCSCCCCSLLFPM